MCRNIRKLYNFEPPPTGEEIRAAALQFVRKISGFATPSAANQEAFDRAVDEVAQAPSGAIPASQFLINGRQRGAVPRLLSFFSRIYVGK